jgi:hypothetical protein
MIYLQIDLVCFIYPEDTNKLWRNFVSPVEILRIFFQSDAVSIEELLQPIKTVGFAMTGNGAQENIEKLMSPVVASFPTASGRSSY